MFSHLKHYVDYEALQNNIRILGKVGSIMPVIKNNAYGHGLLTIAELLNKEKFKYFAVGTVEEGLALRKAGYTQNIIALLGITSVEEAIMAKTSQITPLIYSMTGLKMLCSQLGPESTPHKPILIAIKLETGMARLGFDCDNVPALLETLRQYPQIKPTIIISHLACADMPEKSESVLAQAELFLNMCTTIRNAYPKIKYSLTNSAGTLAYPSLHFDLTRPGISMYGYNPFYNTLWHDLGQNLKPVMSISTKILQIRSLPPNYPISYGHTCVSQKKTTIAVLNIGYADGLSRLLSNKGHVLINEKRLPILGRICMGLCMVDISKLADNSVREGDLAYIIGGQGKEAISAQDIAHIWQTIPYEVLCMLGKKSLHHAG